MHDKIYSLVHRKCHPKSEHSHIKHHTTLNTIFSVAITIRGKPPFSHSHPLHVQIHLVTIRWLSTRTWDCYDVTWSWFPSRLCRIITRPKTLRGSISIQKLLKKMQVGVFIWSWHTQESWKLGFHTKGHFTHEPRVVTMNFVRAQKKVSKGRPNTPPSCVVWSRIPKCSVKSYVTRPSTKCYFNKFLFMRILAHTW